MANELVDLLKQLIIEGPIYNEQQKSSSKSGTNSQTSTQSSGEGVLSQLIKPEKQPSLMETFQQQNQVNPWQGRDEKDRKD